jgi:hypothetical protein
LRRTSVEASLSAVVVSGAVSFIVALATSLSSEAFKHRRKRYRTEEALTVEMVRERLKPYTEFMRAMKPMSRTRLQRLSEDDRRKEVAAFVEVFNGSIYDSVGLVATHETREVILRTRARCRQYAEGRGAYDSMTKCVCALHHMLRADMGLRQPGLAHTIERLRHQGPLADNSEAVDKLIMGMNTINHEEPCSDEVPAHDLP